MADPFSVEPPQWMTNIVGRPVDMTSVGTAVGNFARQKLRGPTIEQKYSLLQRSRMQKELQMMDTRLANETADQAVQMRLNQEKSQARLEVADFLTRHSGEDAVLDAPITARTPEGVAAIYQIKENAAKFKLSKQKQVQDVELTRGLGKILSSSPNVTISAKAAALQATLRQDGWTSENILEYGNLSAEHNALAAESKLKSEKDIQPKPIVIDLGDGTTMSGVYNPQTGAFTKHVAEKNNAAESGIKILEQDVSKFELQASKARAAYEGLLAADPNMKEAATKSAFGTYTSLQNDLLRKQSSLNKLRKKSETDAAKPEKSDSSNQELNLALEAIKAGVSRESVARKYKERTGQDLPE